MADQANQTPRLINITIECFRSIGENPVNIQFTRGEPLVLIGENNAGKSNIVRAIDILFGEWHPKSKEFEDHDYFGRRPNNGTKIVIQAGVSGFSNRLGRSSEYTCGGFKLIATKGDANKYSAIEHETGSENLYVSNQLRNELSSVLVSSEQSLSYQLSYSSKFTLLSRVTKSFHDRLVSNENRVERLKSLFDSILTIFEEVAEFTEFKGSMSSIAGRMMSNMTHGLEIDFSAYDPSNYFKTVRVHPHENNRIRSVEEIGAGQQQLLALSFAHAYAKSFKGHGLILIIDEPETHLHPLAQKWLARTMFQMASDGLQLVITTHSPHFIDLQFLQSIHLVRKDVDGSLIERATAQTLADHCLQHGAHHGRTTADSIVAFYSGNTADNILKGFFANKIVLVEGSTEELALPVYLLKSGLDVLEKRIDIIHVGGKGNLPKWWRFFTFYSIPVYICFDNDSKDDKAGTKRREALKTIGIIDNEIDTAISTHDWNISDRYCVFGTDFETTMRNSFPEYKEIELEIVNSLGPSKPIVARETALRLEYNSSSDAWKKLDQLATFIEAI